MALATIAVGAVPFLWGNVALVLLGCAAAGVAIPWAFVAMATTRQQLTPNHLQGRTASATGVSLQLPQLVSTGVGAAIVAVIDYRVLTVAAAVVIAAAAVWLLGRGRGGDDVAEQTVAEQTVAEQRVAEQTVTEQRVDEQGIPERSIAGAGHGVAGAERAAGAALPTSGQLAG
jgi:hypothetical protein